MRGRHRRLRRRRGGVAIGTFDMRDSFERLTARRETTRCITLPTGPSPRSDERILEELGLLDELGRDYLYAFAILAQMGLHPRYPTSRACATTRTRTSKRHTTAWRRWCATPRRPQRTRCAYRALEDLRTWLVDNLVADERAGMPDEDGKPRGAFKLLRPRMVRWAFLSWDTAGRS